MATITKKQKLSVKKQTAGAIIAIIFAAALPQIFHVLGSQAGVGNALGNILLPMHLPVILTGFLAGPFAAGAAGLISPLLSYGLSGMPAAALLPFMMIELAVYGICAGILRDVHIPDALKVLIVQIAGRTVRAGAILIGFYGLNSVIRPEIIITSIKTGLIGIALQIIIIPLVIYRLRKADNE